MNTEQLHADEHRLVKRNSGLTNLLSLYHASCSEKGYNRLDAPTAGHYFARLLLDDRIILAHLHGHLVGYLESWRLTQDQLARLSADRFAFFKEPIIHGPILFVSDIYVTPEYRSTRVTQSLWRELYLHDTDAQHIAWRRGDDKPIKLISRQKAVQRFTMEERKVCHR